MTNRFYKKPRLPRKLKKAARHVDFNVCDMQQMTDVSTDPNNVVMKLDVDYRVVMHPVGYPKTRSVQRLIALWRRKIGQAHRRAVSDMLRRQYLEQHPGMLTYKDNPHPAPPKNEHPGYMVMTKEQMQRIADRVKPDLLSPSPEAVAQIQLDDIHVYQRVFPPLSCVPMVASGKAERQPPPDGRGTHNVPFLSAESITFAAEDVPPAL